MNLVLSYTFISDFNNCPHKAQHKYVLKDLPKTPPSPEQTLGVDVHKAFERRLKLREPFEARFSAYEPFAAAVENSVGEKLVEEPIAITSDGASCNQFDKNVFLRGKGDAIIINGNAAAILDWKTGKEREDPFELEVFALMIKCRYRGVDTISGRYVWLKSMSVGRAHDLSNVARTYNEIKLVSKKAEALLHSGKPWPKEPNPLCGWCPVLTCEHNQTRGK